MRRVGCCLKFAKIAKNLLCYKSRSHYPILIRISVVPTYCEPDDLAAAVAGPLLEDPQQEGGRGQDRPLLTRATPHSYLYNIGS